MKTNMTLEQIAEAIGEKVWNGQRIYVRRAGYNTKKMKTTAYIYKVDTEVRFSAFVQCDAQGAVWCQQRADEARAEMEQMVQDTLPADEVIIEKEKPSDVIITPEGGVVDLNDEVCGYILQWREVRIPINRFGKLATRNRQFQVFLKCKKKDAPRNFMELSPAAYQLATNEGKRSEQMLEPYTEPTNYEKLAETIQNN